MIRKLPALPTCRRHGFLWRRDEGSGLPPPVVVAVGLNVAASSDDGGATWASRAIGAGDFRGLAYNGLVYVAVGSAGVAAISSDGGKTWAPITIAARDFRGVTWNGNVFCAVGTGVSGADSTIYTSPDGASGNWTKRTAPTFDGAATMDTVARGAGNLLFIPTDQTIGGVSKGIISTNDGASWTAVTMDSFGGFSTAAWNGTIFVALSAAAGVGSFSDTSNAAATVWTFHSTGVINQTHRGAAWSGTIFTCVASVPTNASMSSPDGLVWTSRVMPTGAYFGVTWTGLAFVAVGTNVAAISSNALSWAATTIPAGSYKAVASNKVIAF